jgi:hypothetical protein
MKQQKKPSLELTSVRQSWLLSLKHAADFPISLLASSIPIVRRRLFGNPKSVNGIHESKDMQSAGYSSVLLLLASNTIYECFCIQFLHQPHTNT